EGSPEAPSRPAPVRIRRAVSTSSDIYGGASAFMAAEATSGPPAIRCAM
ncbi:MAG: hypothetical protein K0R20_2763, partial [Actinomycetia bacterium]|nr:hypothetical protein [Actinomycetes bacterium]